MNSSIAAKLGQRLQQKLNFSYFWSHDLYSAYFTEKYTRRSRLRHLPYWICARVRARVPLILKTVHNS